MGWFGHSFDEGPPPSVSCATKVGAKVFGLAIGTVGFALLSLPVVFDVSNVDDASLIWLNVILLALGLPPFLIGLYYVLGRNGVNIDGDANLVEAWRGVVVPIWRRRHELGPSRRVSLCRIALSSGPSSNRRTARGFGVTLTGTGDIAIDLFTNELAARRFAERAARTFGLPMENRLVTPVDVRTVAELDRPLAARIRAGRAPDQPALARDSRLHVEPGGAKRRLTLRPARSPWNRRETLFMAAIAALPAWWLGPLLLDAEAPVLLRIGGAVVVGVMVWLVFGDLLTTTEVTVSPEALRVQKRVGPLNRTRSVPLAEIEELYFDGAQVRVVSDTAAISFASGHTDADAEAAETLLRSWVAAAYTGPSHA